MYHSVSTVPDGPMRPFAVPPALLREQLSALAGAGYRLVGLTEALERGHVEKPAHWVGFEAPLAQGDDPLEYME